jgi:pimeloyl-ACP methyl ester carboxylesterase
MKKTFYSILWFLLGLLLLLALITAVAYMTYRFQSPREEAAYPPPGQMVAVNGHRLHSCAAGERNDLITVLDVGHYVHSEAAERIAAETRAFIERIR